MERISSRRERFATFQSYKYRFKAMFGDDIDQSFNEIKDVMIAISISVEMLAKHYWPENKELGMDSDKRKQHLEEKNRHESIIWNKGKNFDEIGPRVREAVNRIKDVVRKESIKQRSLPERLFSLCNRVRASRTS